MAHEIVIPRLGWSMEEGTFVGWRKRDGETVKRGETLFELEGEKATQDIEAVDEGILRIPPTGPATGSVIKVGAIIGYLVAVGEELPGTAASPAVAASVAASVAVTPAAAPSVRRLAREAGIALMGLAGSGPGGRVMPDDVRRASSPSSADEPQVRVRQATGSRQAVGSQSAFASPRARRVARELGVDWSQLIGSGARGRIRERDVRAAVDLPPLAATTARSLPVSNRRRVIADKMRTSRQQTVGVTLTSRADATNLVCLRQQFKATSYLSIVPSITDIVLKLVAAFLKQHPLLAGRWDGESITLPHEADLHLGLAVDTEGGLLVPVIRQVPSLSLPQIARQSRDLIERARSGKLAVSEMQGGVFTITNLGAFGIDAFTPIINSPESAILGLGAIRREPVVRDDGQIVAREMLTLSLTFDHCLIDGAPAARFLQTLVSAITNPSAWLLGE